MPSLREIKDRMQSVASVVKVTSVMNMISVSKFSLNSKKYNISNTILDNLVNRVKELFDQRLSNNALHCYLKENSDSNNAVIIVLSSDRGLCGSLNNHILYKANRLVEEYINCGLNVNILPIGKKSFDFFSKKKSKNTNTNTFKLLTDKAILSESLDIAKIDSILGEIFLDFGKQNIRFCEVVSFKFKSILNCNLFVSKLLPFADPVFQAETPPSKITHHDSLESIVNFIEYYYRHHFINIYYSHLISIHSSRMSAMDNATKNGKELQKDLILMFNHKRQTNITNELLDIVSCSTVVNGDKA